MSAVNELAPLSGFVLPRPITLQGEDVHRMTFHLIFRGPRDAADPVVARVVVTGGGRDPSFEGEIFSSPFLPIRKNGSSSFHRPYIFFFQFFTVFFYIFGKKKGVQVLLKPGDIVKERR